MQAYDTDQTNAPAFVAAFMKPDAFIRGQYAQGSFTMLESNGTTVCTVELADCPNPFGVLDMALRGEAQGPQNEIGPVAIPAAKIRRIREEDLPAADVLTAGELASLERFLQQLAAVLIKYGQKTYEEEPGAQRTEVPYVCTADNVRDYLLSSISVTAFLRGTTLVRTFNMLEPADNAVYTMTVGSVTDSAAFVDACNRQPLHCFDLGLKRSLNIADSALRQIRDGSAEAEDVLSPLDMQNARGFLRAVIAQALLHADRELAGDGPQKHANA